MNTLQLMILCGCLTDAHLHASECHAFKPYKKGVTSPFQKSSAIDLITISSRKRALSPSEEHVSKKRELISDIDFEKFHIRNVPSRGHLIVGADFAIINQLRVDGLREHSQDFVRNMSINLSAVFQPIEVIDKAAQSEQFEFDAFAKAGK